METGGLAPAGLAAGGRRWQKAMKQDYRKPQKGGDAAVAAMGRGCTFS